MTTTKVQHEDLDWRYNSYHLRPEDDARGVSLRAKGRYTPSWQADPAVWREFNLLGDICTILSDARRYYLEDDFPEVSLLILREKRKREWEGLIPPRSQMVDRQGQVTPFDGEISKEEAEHYIELLTHYIDFCCNLKEKYVKEANVREQCNGWVTLLEKETRKMRRAKQRAKLREDQEG